MSEPPVLGAKSKSKAQPPGAKSKAAGQPPPAAATTPRKEKPDKRAASPPRTVVKTPVKVKQGSPGGLEVSPYNTPAWTPPGRFVRRNCITGEILEEFLSPGETPDSPYSFPPYRVGLRSQLFALGFEELR